MDAFIDKLKMFGIIAVILAIPVWAVADRIINGDSGYSSYDDYDDDDGCGSRYRC